MGSRNPKTKEKDMPEKTIPNVPKETFCQHRDAIYRRSEVPDIFVVASFSMPRVSATSPASIVMRYYPASTSPWQVHWYNAEFGGYGEGGYHKEYEKALSDFMFRVKKRGFYNGFELQWQLLGAGSLPVVQKESEVYP
tara:strand:- start:285 stop:698 length:414 start_codon:yes stop_codon:yes gene_type:complete